MLVVITWCHVTDGTTALTGLSRQSHRLRATRHPYVWLPNQACATRKMAGIICNNIVIAIYMNFLFISLLGGGGVRVLQAGQKQFWPPKFHLGGGGSMASLPPPWIRPCLHASRSTMDFYADDTPLSSSSNWTDLPALREALSQDLREIEKWSGANNMYINVSKTKAMLVSVSGSVLSKTLQSYSSV